MESTGWVTRPWPRWLISYTLGRATHLHKIRTRWKTGLMSKSQGPRSGPMWWHQCGPILNICAKPVPLVSHFIWIWTRRENIMPKLGKHVKKMENCCNFFFLNWKNSKKNGPLERACQKFLAACPTTFSFQIIFGTSSHRSNLNQPLSESLRWYRIKSKWSDTKK